MWPEYASDYVRGYSLCEHHIKNVLDSATVRKYESYQSIYAKRYNELAEIVANFLESELADLDQSDERLQDSHGCCKVASELYFALHKAMDKGGGYHVVGRYMPLGEPTSIYIDDAEVDRLISLRITSLASDQEKGRGVFRCSAHRKQSPDERCINRVKVDGDICEQCKKHGRHDALLFAKCDALKRALFVLRDSMSSDKINDAQG